VEPRRLARLEDDESEARLALRIADLAADVERLRVAGLGHPVRDHGLPRVAGGLADLEDRVAARGLDGEPHDALALRDPDGLRFPRLAGLSKRLLAFTLLDADADVLEELLLLFLEELALAFRRLLPRLRADAHVRELPKRTAVEGERVQ